MKVIFPPEEIERLLEQCDEVLVCLNEEIYSLVNLDAGAEKKLRLEKHENNVKLVKIEKLLYRVLLKPNNSAIFPQIMAKYRDLMSVFHDLSGNMMSEKVIGVDEYLEFGFNAGNHKRYMQTLCNYGERISKLPIL